uniref:Uncharacterized protein n=1 Tax=Clytia hemisphaerica TaxID=252671 RepID=A0A7M5XCB0_9CNID
MDFLRGGNQRNTEQQRNIDVNRVTVDKSHQQQITVALQNHITGHQKIVDSTNVNTSNSEPNYISQSRKSSTDSINKNKQYQFVDSERENVEHDELMLHIDDDCILDHQSVEGGGEIKPRPSSSMLEQSGGRDSGISTESSSSKYQELFSKERVETSQKELQSAKKKLEELRLLRFEEKNILRQEIEQLHEKVDTEESRTTKLEEELKKSETDRLITSQRVSDLSKEQEIGSQINMMQEQEIVRLEMKLKEEALERVNLSQQIDQQRRNIIEKDKLRLKLQGEIYILNERITQLEESNMYYKNESDINYRKSRENDQALVDLKAELKTLQKKYDNATVELTTANLQVKMLESEKSKIEDIAKKNEVEIEDLKKKIDSLTQRSEQSEKYFKNREDNLQQDLENVSFNESKLMERCEELETLYHDTRREKDEQHFKLKQVIERAAALEQRVKEVEDEKTDMEFDLSELKNSLVRSMKHSVTNDQEGNSTTVESNNNTNTILTPKEIEAFFNENKSKMYKYQHEIDDLSSQLVKERTIVNDLNDTLDGLKNELSKAQSNMHNISSLKDTLETQQQRTNETLRIQEKDFDRKRQENDDLREIISDYERRSALLENEISQMNEEIKNLSNSHKEERKKLKARLHEVETQKQIAESSMRKSQNCLEGDKERLADDLMRKTRENGELKQELDKLIEDNKNLAKRLLHLESYSDRLSEMLEQQQANNQKLKDKSVKENRLYRNESGEKEVEISTLKNQLDDLNRSLNDKQDMGDRLGTKLKQVKDSNKDLEKHVKDLDKYNAELKKRLDLVNEAHMTAERKLVTGEESVLMLKQRVEDQKKVIEDLFIKIKNLEQDKTALKEGLQTSEKRLHLKEDLITELTKKTGQAAENFNSLRFSLEKAEHDGKQYEKNFFDMKKNQMNLEKALNESEAERSVLKEQISDLQRLLVRSEDEKEFSMGECARFQRQLENERISLKELQEKYEENNKRKEYEILQDQMTLLRSELQTERKQRERLEDLYYKRDDQVTKLRSTFDQSLNTISKDTKNIKSILGKSLKKLDKEIDGNDVTDDDMTSSEKNFTVDDYTPQSGRFSNSRYLNLASTSSHRSKSAHETPVKEIRYTYSTPKITPPPSNANVYNRVSPLKESPRMIASNVPTHARYHDTPTRDSSTTVRITSSDRSSRSSKRYSK